MLPWPRSNCGLVSRGCHKTKSFMITSCLKFDTFLFVLIIFRCGQDMTICAACAPPGGGRNPVTPRFLRHFSMFSIPSSAEHTLKHIFKVMKNNLSSMCLDIPFLYFILWPIHGFGYFLFSFLRPPTLPPFQYFLPSLRSLIYPHNHWLIDSFIDSLIFFLPPGSSPPLPLFSTSLTPSPSIPLLFFSLWRVFTIFLPVFENQTLLRVVNFFVFINVIFQSIVSGFLIDFPQDVRNCADAIVGARFVSLVRSPLMVLIVPKKFAFYDVVTGKHSLLRNSKTATKTVQLVLQHCCKTSWKAMLRGSPLTFKPVL